MECPKCRNEMHEILTSEGQKVVCCGTCCISWFSENELRQYLLAFSTKHHAINNNERVAGPGDMAKKKDFSGFCPKCNRALEPHYIAGSGITINSCYQCGGSIVSYDQLTVLEKWYVTASRTARSSLSVSKPDNSKIILIDSSEKGIAGIIEEDNPVIHVPWLTMIIILVNALCFLLICVHPKSMEYFFLIPKLYIDNIANDFWPIIFCAFGHASLAHLIGNMYFLFIFGDNIEDRTGWPPYFFLYFFCAIFSSISHVIIFNQSTIPMIGASGAISGIMGAYLYLYPRAKLKIFSSIFGFPLNIRLSAWIYLLFWFFGSNIIFAFMKIPGIAWDAHITGFVSGYIGIYLLKKCRLY